MRNQYSGKNYLTYTKTKKGITLIALVITIIVLLILAGISISAVVGENGVATKAKKAGEETDKASIIEEIGLEMSDKNLELERNLTEEEFIAILEANGTLSGTEDILNQTLTTNPDKTNVNKSYTIKVSDIYNGRFYVGSEDVDDEEPEITKYTVTFYNYTGSIYEVYSTVKVNSGETINENDLPTNPTLTEEYTFVKWTTTAGGETAFDFENTAITKDTSIYAYYQEKTSSSCFIAGTKVLTEKGLVNIEDVEVGMMVYSYNLETEERELKEVTKKFVTEVTDDLGKVYVNGEVIESTVEHPYYVVGKGYTKVKDLKAGDRLKTVEGEELVIEKVELIESEGLTTVYNMEVEDNHNYYVGEDGILVHNKAPEAGPYSGGK